MSDQSRRLQTAIEAVAAASVVCRQVQRDLAGIVSATKDDKSPVTIADFASQAVIARMLTEGLGTFTLVAEESADMLRERSASGDHDLIERVTSVAGTVWPGATASDVLDAIDLGAGDPPADSVRGFWTLDPVDGTKGFLRGQQYAVSLAYIENGTPIIGVLGCPNLSRNFSRPFDEPDDAGCLYVAERGGGLYELPGNEPRAHPVRIRRLIPRGSEPIRMCESAEAAHSDHGASKSVIEKLGESADPARLDSQAKYAVVARGQADLYLRLPSKKGYIERIWDHAAGALCASEAGCLVSDAWGKPLDFSCGRGLEKNSGIVVAPPALHANAIAAIAEVLGA